MSILTLGLVEQVVNDVTNAQGQRAHSHGKDRGSGKHKQQNHPHHPFEADSLLILGQDIHISGR